MRGVDLDTGRSLGGWRFTKVPPGRQLAMRQSELDSFGDRLLSLAAS